MMMAAAWLWLVSGGAGCIAVEGEQILARHLSEAVPAFSRLDGEAVLGYAPAPGARRTLTAQEVARLAARHGLAVEGREVCFERALAPLTAERVLEALRRALGREDARIELLDFSRYPAPPGELEFPRSGLGAPPGGRSQAVLWRGRLRCDGRRSLPVWARVRITAPGRRLVAAENLAPGMPVEVRQLRLEEGEWFPLGEAPLEAVEAAAGLLPRRWIPAGTVLYARMLAPPREIERGQTVAVEVASGGAHLRFQARAETGGRAGDVILVRHPSNGRRLAARVEGPGKAVIDASFRERAAVGPGGRGAGR